MNAQLHVYSIEMFRSLLRFVRLQKGLDPEEEFSRFDIDDLDSFVRSNYPASKKPEPPKKEVCAKNSVDTKSSK